MKNEKQKKEQISVQEITLNREQKLYKDIAWNLLLSLCLIAGGMVVVWMVWDDLRPGLPMILAMMVLTLCCGVAEERLRKRNGFVAVCYLIPWVLVLIFTGVQGYLAGILSWFNAIIQRWNQLHEGGAALFPVQTDSTSILAVTLLFTVLLTELSWWLVRRQKLFASTIYCLFWVFVALFSGVFIPYVGVGLFLGLAGMFLSVRGGHITKRNLFWFVLIFVLLILNGTLFVNREVVSITEWRQQTKEQIHTMRYGKESLPAGDLEEASKLHESGDEMLRINTDQQKTLYLRGFVGGKYQNRKWVEEPASEYSGKYSGMMKWLRENNFDPLTQVAQYYSLGEKDSIPESNTVQVRATGASRYYVYVPVSSIAVPSGRFGEQKDTRIKNTGLTGANQYVSEEISDYQPSELLTADDWVSDPASDAQKQYCNAETVYRQFVYDTYTQTSTSMNELMQRVFWDDYESESDGIYSALSRIREVLNENIQYTDHPQTAPEDVEPLEWFLEDAREGNAVWYASAATEAFRAHGIPARYVEGYYVKDTRSAESNGEEISLTGQDAHAWVEVYFDGIGWLPVDVTPGYYYDAVTLQQMVSQPDTVQKNAALSDNRYETNNISDGDAHKNTKKKPLKTVLHVAAICLGIVGIVVIFLTALIGVAELVRIFSIWRERRYESQASDEERVRYKEIRLYHLLDIYGIDACLGWNREAVDEEVSAQFTEINAGEYIRVSEILEKAVYGGIPLKVYEERTLDSFIEKIFLSKQKSSWKQRFCLHYEMVYCLKKISTT